MKGIIRKLRKFVREQKYTISTHANEEMSGDDLMAVDVEQAVLTGYVLTRLTDDPRGHVIMSLAVLRTERVSGSFAGSRAAKGL